VGTYVATFTTNTNGWVYLQPVTIPYSVWTTYKYIKIEFELVSDGSGVSAGWFIDDVKLYAFLPSTIQNADNDNNGGTDGIEFYAWGSSPVKLDTDEDGLSDVEELSTYDLRYPTIDNGPADPSQMDIFIEVDWMSGHELDTQARNYLNGKFSPKLVTLHWITIDFNTDHVLTHVDTITFTPCDHGGDYYLNKFTDSHFHLYHYMCSVHANSNPVLYGASHRDFDTFMVFDHSCETCHNSVEQGHTMMHELGHDLNFGEEGTYYLGATNVMLQGCWNPDGFTFDYTTADWLHMNFGSGGDISDEEHI